MRCRPVVGTLTSASPSIAGVARSWVARLVRKTEVVKPATSGVAARRTSALLTGMVCGGVLKISGGGSKGGCVGYRINYARHFGDPRN